MNSDLLFLDNQQNPLYKPPEVKLSEKEYINWIIENDPRCPLFCQKNELALVNSGKIEKEIIDLYRLCELEYETGYMMSKADKLRLKLLKQLAMKRSITRSTVIRASERLERYRSTDMVDEVKASIKNIYIKK